MSESEISERLSVIRAEIAAAAERSGRRAEDIILVGATKMNSAERVREAIDAGLMYCGENRVQELTAKYAEGAYNGAHIHFIGRLQKNKVKYVVGLAELIHSVDSAELLEAIAKQAEKKGIIQDVLLEVNIANESSKTGFSAEEIPTVLAFAASFPSVKVRGLMAIPPICSSGEENSPYFRAMNQLFIDNCRKKYDNVRMDFMSMGMSGDYACAIECGANMVRIGTALFGERHYGTKQL